MPSNTLQLILILLASAVVAIGLFRLFRLPPLLAYLTVGILAGPHGLGWLPESEEGQHLAEFGVVFLMFTVGLEFSLPQLKTMRGTVFGLGSLQVGLTMLAVLAIGLLAGLDWKAGLALGGVLAMSSTAIVSKLLAERIELHSHHGRKVVGVLLFQDLAVVPLLILVPALAAPAGNLTATLGSALFKAVVVLSVLLFFGQRLMRPWFHLVARRKSSELFMLNVLLVTLGMAWLTSLSGLSLALGAFLAGVLISETEYRYQVESDIKPFRDMLLGLFFVTIGMLLDIQFVLSQFLWVLLALAGLLAGKTVLVWGAMWFRPEERSVALRTALTLAQAGEFGFVLLFQANELRVIDPATVQVVLAAMVLSMLAAPFLIQHNALLARYLSGGEWADRAAQLHEIAIKTFGTSGHVIVCGYGRSGQHLTRFLEKEGLPFIALDVDPQRVKAAAVAGESVVYGDAGRREVLMAAGLNRARAVVVTYADPGSALKVLHHVHELKPELPVIVRTMDDTELDRLKQAGATEVVPEVLEGSLMLASHTLMLLGVPLSRVVKSVRAVREARYNLLRGFFHGATDQDMELTETAQPRLYSIAIPQGAAAIGRSLGELDLDSLLVRVTAVRRRNIKALDPQPETTLEEGDVLVLMGAPENLAAAEMRLLQG